MWIDNQTTLQQFPNVLEKMLNDRGWSTLVKYRAFSGSTNQRKFAEVRLFRSVGTDGQIRNFGMVHGYGYQSNPDGAQEFISQNSVLGDLGKGDGTKTEFQLIVYPIEPGSEYIYVDGQLVNSGYEVDPQTGKVTFTAAPEADKKLTASYTPSPLAPQPIKRMTFFLFEDVRGEKLVKVGDPQSILPDGDGTKKKFEIPTTSTIKATTLKIFINQVEVDPINYTFASADNSITFTSGFPAPVTGAELHAEFTITLSGTSSGGVTDFGDIETIAFDPNKPEDLCKVAYTALNYLYPSLPTVTSFTPLSNYNRGWQRDSSVYYWGNVTKDRIVLWFRPDPTAGPEFTYFAPLYIGRLTTVGKSPRKNHIIISGCRTEDEVKWASNKKLGPYIVDYGPNTANGNRDIMLQQSIGGTYYQRHYLSFITHDKEMDSGEARFNPSVYSGKYHIGPIYVVHPNDGIVGRLDEVYAVHPKNIYQMDDIEVDEKAENEDIGIGDGSTKVFHLAHTPYGTTLNIQVDCVEKTLTTDYTVDKELKTVTFVTAPAAGAKILANYDYKQVYRFNLTDAPVAPYVLETASPYAPIGLGVLKENKA